MGMEEPRDVMANDESNSPQDDTNRKTLGWSPQKQFLLLMAGVGIPIGCFVIGYPNSPTYQSDQWRDCAQLLLTRPSCMPLYPFLLYSMACLLLLVKNSAKWSKKFPVRLGIYGGVLLALEYCVLFAFADTGSGVGLIEMAIGALLFGGLVVLVTWLISLIVRNFRLCMPFVAVATIAAIAVEAVVGWLTYGGSPALAFIFLFFIGCLQFSTPFALAAYSIASIDLLRHTGGRRFRFTLAQLLGVTTWLAAHFGAWRMSVNWMLIEYAKLPTEPHDDCYVCTAAARGHRWLTGVESCGRPISEQMRRLKAAELILRHTVPRLHRICRAVYDRIGPPLAARLGRPWLADIAFLSLKPVEWSCWLAVRCLLSSRGVEAVHGFYSKKPSEA